MKYAQPIYDEVQAVTPGKINYGIQEYPKLNELYRINKMAVYTEVDFHDNPYIAYLIHMGIRKLEMVPYKSY